MTKRTRSRIPALLFLLAALAVAAAAPASAQVMTTGQTPPPEKEKPANFGYKPPTFYIHVAGGFGLDWMSASEIADLMSPYTLSGFGFNYFAGIRVGIMNIFQYERRVDGDMLHDFFYSDDNTRINMTHAIPKIDLFKINPLFWMPNKETSIFLVYGAGKRARFLDDDDSGWSNGDVSIYGLEFNILNKTSEMAVSIEYRSVQYNSFDLSGYGSITTPFKSSFIVLAVHYGIGLGF